MDEITLRSACRNNFNWKKNCFYCGEEFIKDKKHPDRNKTICKSSELESKNTVIRKCKERGDKWVEEVSRRLSLSIDLVASDAEYHKQCKANFFICKDIPGQKNVVKTPGPPASEPMKQTFENLCDWLDNQAELFTIKELHEKLCSISKSGEDLY